MESGGGLFSYEHQRYVRGENHQGGNTVHRRPDGGQGGLAGIGAKAQDETDSIEQRRAILGIFRSPTPAPHMARIFAPERECGSILHTARPLLRSPTLGD